MNQICDCDECNGREITARREKPMNPIIKQMWVNALTSGEYEKTSGTLRDDCGFCALGVLCDLYSVNHGVSWDGTHGKYEFMCASGALPKPVMDWAGLEVSDPEIVDDDGMVENVSSINDSTNFSFPQIAKMIEKGL